MASTFDTFVPSAATRRAVDLCRAAALRSADAPNPLFLHGPSGAGKTHLLEAIHHAISPGAAVLHLPGAELVQRLVGALRRDALADWCRSLHALDALLVDDFNLLGTPVAEGELLRLLDDAAAHGVQVVVTSLHPPARPTRALSVEITLPDLPARIEIARHACRQRGLALSEHTLQRLARRHANNPRELQAAVARTAFLREHARRA